MKSGRKSLDRISTLPQDTIEQILSLMSIRDAIRTSILSKKWRYWWTRMPKLVFNDELVNEASSDVKDEEISKYKLVNAIFHILLLRRGSSISELCISIADADIIVNELDQIILHFSWTKNIKKFVFKVDSMGYHYKLPCSFFSLQGLEHLHLSYCEFELPLMLSGFNMLKSLYFYEVKITADMLQRFLTSCPLLEELTLITAEYEIEFTECELVELFKCLPSVQVLDISHLYIEHLAAGSMPHKLPISLLPHLRRLDVGVCYFELSTVVCVISSCPNLEKIKVEICCGHGRWCPYRQAYNNLPDIQDYYSGGLKLDHLKEMEIGGFHNHAVEMEFVKLIMAKSPVLKKARIELNYHFSLEEQVKMLRDLLYLPLPRASPAAKFIVEHPNKSYLNANQV